MKIDDHTEISDVLYNADEEMAIIIPKSDGNYNIQCKKRLLNNDGLDAGWLYADIPNVKLNENGKYVIEPPKEDEI